MDEAFLYLNEMIQGITDINGSIISEEGGFEMEIERMSIETPVELCIISNASGMPEIGTVPPLYSVETSFQPSYHTIRINLEINQK